MKDTKEQLNPCNFAGLDMRALEKRCAALEKENAQLNAKIKKYSKANASDLSARINCAIAGYFGSAYFFKGQAAVDAQCIRYFREINAI